MDQITRMIASYIPTVTVDRNVGTELTYRLPASHLQSFEPMLKILESRSDLLNVMSYGIAQTSLEDVFMHIMNTQTVEEEKLEEIAKAEEKKPKEGPSMVKGCSLIGCQLHAMLYKRFFTMCRNWVLVLVQNTIPIVLASISIHIARLIKINKVLPPLLVTMDHYKNNPVALLSTRRGVISQQMRKMEAMYRKAFLESRVPRTIRDVEHIGDFIMNLTIPEYNAFKKRNIVGLQLKNDSVVAWFNNMAYHSVPASLNLYYNAMLKTYCGHCEVQIVNAPMKFTVKSRLEMHNSVRDFGFQLAANVGFAMSFVSAFYVIFYIKERVSRAKLLQLVSGANLWTYWLTGWAFDFVQFLCTTFLLILTMFLYGEEGWDTIPDLTRMLILFLTFIWAILPFIYLCSFVIDVPSAALTFIIMFGVFMGNALFYVVYAFSFPALNLLEEGRALTWIMMSIPQFAVMHGLKNLDKMNLHIPVSRGGILVGNNELTTL